ncbi:MAG TPA: hypothetical protein VJ728_16945 [Candidatus Binataceae bacterium]|nr:hypothetical protein [Candidatus Binataceae bacterium]
MAVKAVKGIRETEKVTVGAIRTALQTWLAPQLSDISQRLTHVEARLDGIDRRLDGLDHRMDGFDHRMDGLDHRLDEVDHRLDSFEQHLQETLRSMRNEMEARFDTVRSDIKRLDNIAELRERLASVEAKLVQNN